MGAVPGRAWNNAGMVTLKLGVMASLERGADAALGHVHEFGLPTCQVTCWNPALYTEQTARELSEASRRYGVEITTLWAGYSGRRVWNFIEGPSTNGLVPP